MDLDDAQTVVEVFAEFIIADGPLEVAVGGGNHADIDLQRPCFADSQHFALLEHAEQLHLQRRRRVADFVKEDRPAIGLFE